MIYKNLRFTFLLCFVFLSFIQIHAKDVPRLSGPVVDQAGVLRSSYETKLSDFIRSVYEQTGNQLQVLTVNSLDDETIEGYSIKVVDEWKLGDKEKDNGVLFLMAVNDRQMRIEVGQGLEGDLTDLQSRRIINGIRPYFKKGNYEAGINFAIKAISAQIGADVTNAPRSRGTRKRKPAFNIFFFLIFFIIMILNMRRRLYGFSRGYGSSWSSSGSSWSGGGGGGWSGGGGGFSGGGSSGSW